MGRKKTTEQFIAELHGKRPSELDTSRVVYDGAHKKIQVMFIACGHWRWVEPNNLLRGIGCSHGDHDCRRKTTDQFIAELHEKRPGELDTSKLDYDGWDKKIWVMFIACGHWRQITPNSLLSGSGCSKCQPGTDNNMVYIWMSDVKIYDKYLVKFGVSSQRLDDIRINQVAKEHNLTVKWHEYWQVENATQVEQQLLKLGEPTEWMDGNGSTEFRLLTASEFNQALEMMQSHELHGEKSDRPVRQ